MERIKGAVIYAFVTLLLLFMGRVFLPLLALAFLPIIWQVKSELNQMRGNNEKNIIFYCFSFFSLIPFFFYHKAESSESLLLFPSEAILQKDKLLGIFLLIFIIFFLAAFCFLLLPLIRRGVGEISKAKAEFGDFLYLVIPFTLVNLMLVAVPNSWTWFCLGVLTPWVSDSFAWFVGKNWGKTKLVPKLSPKKTVAGFWGAIFASALFYSIAFFIFGERDLTVLFSSFLIGAVLSVVAQMGDLWASCLKREAGVKDSGNLIPGHGGLLDRIDSSLTILPILSLLLIGRSCL